MYSIDRYVLSSIAYSGVKEELVAFPLIIYKKNETKPSGLRRLLCPLSRCAKLLIALVVIAAIVAAIGTGAAKHGEPLCHQDNANCHMCNGGG